MADTVTHAPTNVWDRFSKSSPDETNEKGELLSCPTSTPRATSTPQDYSTENQELQTAAADISSFRYDENGNPIIDDTKVLGASQSSESLNENVSPFAYVLLFLGLVFMVLSSYLFIKSKKEKRRLSGFNKDNGNNKVSL